MEINLSMIVGKRRRGCARVRWMDGIKEMTQLGSPKLRETALDIIVIYENKIITEYNSNVIGPMPASHKLNVAQAMYTMKPQRREEAKPEAQPSVDQEQPRHRPSSPSE